MHRGEGGVLGWAVAVEEGDPGAGFRGAAGVLDAHRLAAAGEPPQTPEAGRVDIDLTVEQAGGQEGDVGAVAAERGGEARRVEQVFARRHADPRAVQQRAPDFQGGGVEGQGAGLHHRVAGADPDVVVVGRQPDHAARRHQHPLRRAGGARGVHQTDRAVLGRGVVRRCGQPDGRQIGVGAGQGLRREQAVPAVRQGAPPGGVGDHRAASGVGEDRRVAFGGVFGVEGDIDRPGGGDADQRRHRVGVAGEQQADPVPRPDARVGKFVGDAVGAAGEAAIAQAGMLVLDRDGLGTRRHLLQEQVVEAFSGWQGGVAPRSNPRIRAASSGGSRGRPPIVASGGAAIRASRRTAKLRPRRSIRARSNRSA